MKATWAARDGRERLRERERGRESREGREGREGRRKTTEWIGGNRKQKKKDGIKIYTRNRGGQG